jgi:Subtilase family
MIIPSCIQNVVTLVALVAISTCTEAISIRNKLVKKINETEQTLIDFVADIDIPISTTSTSTSRRVWITYERGQQVSVLSSMEFNRQFSTNMMPIYDFPAMSSIVTMATDEEIAALMANTTIGSINVTDDPIRYPMVHSTRNVHQGYRNLQSGQTTPYGIELTQVDQLWSATGLTGSGVTVCVIDSGLDTSNPDFDTSALSGDSLVSGSQWSTDTSGHGTHVSGIVAASNNGIGVVGAAPGAKIHMVDVFGEDGFAYASALVDAAYKCRVAGANIISMSLGGPQYSDQENRLFTEFFNLNGILAIAAAGNEGSSAYSFPASYDNVLSVGAVDDTKTLAEFSTFNNRVDLVAPGVDILSTLPSNFFCEICRETGQSTYGIVSGTSQATPYVSGIAALLWSYDNTLGVEMIYDALINSAEDLGSSGFDNFYGNGLVSALSAYNSLISSLGGTPPVNAPSIASPPISAPSPLPFSSPPVSAPPVLAPSAATSSCVNADLVFRTDAYPYETFVKLTDLYRRSVLWYGGATQAYTSYSLPTACIDPNGCYLFEFFDQFGDGLCCLNGEGYYELTLDNVSVASGASFGSYVSYAIGGGCQV